MEFFMNLAGTTILDKVIDWAVCQISLVSTCGQEINKLRETLESIRNDLVDAERRRNVDEHDAELMLRRLKSVNFDGEDVIDRYDTLTGLNMIIVGYRQRAETASEESSSRWKNLMIAATTALSVVQFCNYGNIRLLYNFGSKIDDINKRIIEINNHWKRRRNVGDAIVYSSRHLFPPTIPSHVEEYIVGRNSKREMVLNRLTSINQHLAVVAICGVAGIGKTALANLVFNDNGISNHFDKRIWVSIPNETNINDIIRLIIEGIIKQKVDIVPLSLLKKKLRELLDGSRFLLVLDNLCLEDNLWQGLQGSLVSGAQGNKVLFTTQDLYVWMQTVNLDSITLKGLDVDHGWELLSRQALTNEKWDQFPRIKEIGKEIVVSCRGSPLVVKLIGAILRKEDIDDEWTDVLSEMRPLRNIPNFEIYQLMISYRHLSYNIKKCFAYCSVFPKGYEFCKDDLVSLWSAEDLIQSDNTQLENTGDKYFIELFWRSFFEKSVSEKEKYKLPSLVHDLACLVSKHETVFFVNNELVGTNNSKLGYRYGCLIQQNYSRPLELDRIYQYPHLRTLFTYSNGSRVQLNEVPTAIYSIFKFLRVLNLGHTNIQQLHFPVGSFLQLRYLGLNNTDIELLPESICCLYNLQTINLSDCYMFKKLPEGTSNLVNLRHIALDLEWDRIVNLDPMPPGIGSMHLLKTLSRFTVSKEANGGCNIHELRNLELRGVLSISKLENITEWRSVALEANLQQKRYINKLMLQWTKNARTHYEIAVARQLLPHRGLKTLWFKDYPASRFPSWVGDQSFRVLEVITLFGCINCVEFPRLQNLPKLKKLHVEKMDSLRSLETSVDTHFLELEIFTMIDMKILVSWFGAEAGTFPKLKRFKVVNCPNLSLNFDSLRKLHHFPSELALEIQ